MRRQAELPPEFSALAGQVNYIQRVSATEYSSSCPSCGGEVHQDHSWPDRLRMFTDGHPRVWCRKCGYTKFADELDPDVPPPSRAQIESWRQKQIKVEEDRKRSAERALKLLRDSETWERYYAALDDRARSYWRGRGVPDAFQDFWRLGIARGRRFGNHVTDCATIPIFGPQWQIQQIKYRLMDPGDAGRYRYELKGLDAPAFRCDPDTELGDHLYVIEGEIKAMVTYAKLDNSEYSMIGMPGTKPSSAVLDLISRAECVTLVMDPGSEKEAIAIGRAVGLEKVYLLIPPVKIDDGILAAGMTAYDVSRMLQGALKLNAYVTR